MYKKYILVLLIFLGISTHWVWFFDYSILTYGDWFSHFSESMREYLNFPFIWGNESLGEVNLGSSFYPFNYLHGLLTILQFDYATIERVLFMWMIVLGNIICGYLLTYKLTKSCVGAAIASLVYSYNTYFIIGSTGHLTLMMAFAIAPLALLLFMRTLEEKRWHLAVSTGLVFFVVSFYEVRAFYIFAWVCFFYFLWHTFLIEKVSWRSIFRNGLFAFIPIALVILLNLYWIIGLMKLGAISDNAIFSRGLFGNSFMNIREAITLFHPFWTGGASAIFKVQPIPLYFFLIPLFAFLGLWLNRKNKKILFFGVISLFGILLSKQASAPFDGLYLWLYDNFPGFNAFRESSKFYFLVALGYSVLIGSFVSWIWRRFTEKGAQTYAKYFLTMLIAILFLWNTKPLITGEIGTLFVPRHVPADYIVLKDFLLHQPESFRTLWVPTSSRWSIYLNAKPKVSLIDTIQSTWQPLFRTDTSSLPTENRITSIFESSFANNLLDISSIKYVIIPTQDIENDDDFFKDYGKREFFIQELDKISYLKKIDIGTKDLIVYENDNYRPHIYVTQEKETLQKEVSFEKVDFSFKNSTEYSVNLKNISEPVYMNFSEAYHPDWKIRVGEFHWLDVLTKKDYFLPDSFHSENDAKLNSFLIDPEVVCGNTSTLDSRLLGNDICRRNLDGSYDINLTLYFKPQSYFYLGLIISGTTLVLCLSYLGYAGIQSWKRKSLK